MEGVCKSVFISVYATEQTDVELLAVAVVVAAAGSDYAAAAGAGAAGFCL